MWHFCRTVLLALLLIVSQTTEEETIAEGCDNVLDSHYVCPPGSDWKQADVTFSFYDKDDRLNIPCHATPCLLITCNKNSSAEELEINLARISLLRKKQVNLTELWIKDCPTPSQTYSGWLPKLGSEVDSLRNLRLLRSRTDGDIVNLNSEHFGGLQLLTDLRLSGSVEVLGPGLLSNLLECFC